MLATYTVRSLEQARLLADPLKLRILREFVDEPRTTKQVAERLGEKAPRLYRHVQAMLDVGLLEHKEERKKRGTTERYLQAIAARFEVDGSLFSGQTSARARGAGRKLAELAGTLMDEAQREFVAYCHSPLSADDPPTVARVLMRGSRAEVLRLRRQIERLLEPRQPSKRPSTTDETYELSGLVSLLMRPTKRAPHD